MTTPQDILKRKLKFLNIDKYHEIGYTGRGVVVFNSEEPTGHGEMTNMVLKQAGPDVIVLNGTTGGITKGDKVVEYYVMHKGVKYDFEDFIRRFNVKIMTTSLGGSQANKAIQDYLKGVQERTGLIMFCCAGNEGTDGAWGKYVLNDTAIAVGAVYIYEDGTVKLTSYSSIDDEVDFVAPMGTGSGTSASTPFLAGMTACLIQRYGDFNQKECVKILKSLCIDLGQPGKDPKFGWGLPILPLEDKLEILEKLRGEKMDFKDVKPTDWFYEDVKYCIANGLMKGDGDDTFDPQRTVTRAEEAATTRRIHESLMNEIKKLK